MESRVCGLVSSVGPPPHGNNLRHYTKRDLRGRATADINTNRSVQALQVFRGHAVMLQSLQAFFVRLAAA